MTVTSRYVAAAGLLASLSVLSPGAARAAGTDTAPAQPGQHAHVFEYKGDRPVSLGYLLYLPADYGKEPDKKWPVILFLHGSGERGDGTSQINLVKMHGPPKIVETKKEFPFIVISPQCPTKGWWDPGSLAALTDDVLKHYKGDADRVYLTGLSMGGFGTWALAAAHPEKFAAIAPVCGGGDPNAAGRIKDLPTWVFHGEKDDRVPIQRSVDMVDALKRLGAAEVEFTRYPNAGHDCWTATYDNPKLYEWFLAHKRK